ncbi:MAG: four helix bundle protein [Deltaproteobacteria bacterium]|jgi:four helix bundle protein|nr:four helix bundle protein [Deltaproteobacteria bacterium]
MEYIYERLEAWQHSVEFANHVIGLLGEGTTGREKTDIIERAEASSANIAVTIARAKCSITKDDAIKQLYLSRRSLYETMTLLEIFRRVGWISNDQFAGVKIGSRKIASSLVTMMRLIGEPLRKGG